MGYSCGLNDDELSGAIRRRCCAEIQLASAGREDIVEITGLPFAAAMVQAAHHQPLSSLPARGVEPISKSPAGPNTRAPKGRGPSGPRVRTGRCGRNAKHGQRSRARRHTCGVAGLGLAVSKAGALRRACAPSGLRARPAGDFEIGSTHHLDAASQRSCPASISCQRPGRGEDTPITRLALEAARAIGMMCSAHHAWASNPRIA
jgi:hypothetical protein